MSMKKLGGDIPTRRLMQATVGFRSLVARAWAAIFEIEEHDHGPPFSMRLLIVFLTGCIGRLVSLVVKTTNLFADTKQMPGPSTIFILSGALYVTTLLITMHPKCDTALVSQGFLPRPDSSDHIHVRDEYFLQTLVQQDYEHRKHEIRAGQVLFMRTRPGAVFFTQFDYTAGPVTFHIRPATDLPKEWETFPLRVVRSAGKWNCMSLR
ncbi:hypothetical protein B0H13DRAFT_2316333 [Mycena leptocephala]|nr:hypothetical protein B0H13DRAFT_2316333 [Mycena leptocephala]